MKNTSKIKKETSDSHEKKYTHKKSTNYSITQSSYKEPKVETKPSTSKDFNPNPSKTYKSTTYSSGRKGVKKERKRGIVKRKKRKARISRRRTKGRRVSSTVRLRSLISKASDADLVRKRISSKLGICGLSRTPSGLPVFKKTASISKAKKATSSSALPIEDLKEKAGISQISLFGNESTYIQPVPQPELFGSTYNPKDHSSSTVQSSASFVASLVRSTISASKAIEILAEKKSIRNFSFELTKASSVDILGSILNSQTNMLGTLPGSTAKTIDTNERTMDTHHNGDSNNNEQNIQMETKQSEANIYKKSPQQIDHQTEDQYNNVVASPQSMVMSESSNFSVDRDVAKYSNNLEQRVVSPQEGNISAVTEFIDITDPKITDRYQSNPENDAKIKRCKHGRVINPGKKKVDEHPKFFEHQPQISHESDRASTSTGLTKVERIGVPQTSFPDKTIQKNFQNNNEVPKKRERRSRGRKSGRNRRSRNSFDERSRSRSSSRDELKFPRHRDRSITPERYRSHKRRFKDHSPERDYHMRDYSPRHSRDYSYDRKDKNSRRYSPIHDNRNSDAYRHDTQRNAKRSDVDKHDDKTVVDVSRVRQNKELNDTTHGTIHKNAEHRSTPTRPSEYAHRLLPKLDGRNQHQVKKTERDTKQPLGYLGRSKETYQDESISPRDNKRDSKNYTSLDDSSKSVQTPIQDERDMHNFNRRHVKPEEPTIASPAQESGSIEVYDPEAPIASIIDADSEPPSVSPDNCKLDKPTNQIETLIERLKNLDRQVNDGKEGISRSAVNELTNLINSMSDGSSASELLLKFEDSSNSNDNSAIVSALCSYLIKLVTQKHLSQSKPHNPFPRPHSPPQFLEDDDDEVPSSAVELNHRERYLQKLNRQERVIEEVKVALKPHYQQKTITKEEYKEVMRKAVPKICKSKNGEINALKIKFLVDSYVRNIKND